MGQYNPYKPTVLGMEFAPLVRSTVLLDTGSEIGYRFTPDTDNTAVNLARLNTMAPPPGQPLRKTIAVNMYQSQYAPSTGVIRTLTIPVVNGAPGTGSANNGAGTVPLCVRNPSDLAYNALTGPNAFLRVWFDVNGYLVPRYLTGARILDISIKYAITGPFDTYPNGITLSLERPSAGVVFDMDNSLTGPVNQYDNVIPRRSRLGDLNPFWSSVKNPNTDNERAPWVYINGGNNHVGLKQMADPSGTNVNVRLTTAANVAATDQFRVQYLAMEVTYCNEDRTAAGGLEISPGAVITNDLFTYDVPVGSMFSWGFDGYAARGYYYVVTVGQGYCGALSAAYPVPLAVDRVSNGEIYGPHEGIIIRKTLREGETWTREQTDAFPSIALYSSESAPSNTTIVPGSQTYIDQALARADNLTFNADLLAAIVDDVPGGSYPFVRFYARVQPATVAELVALQTDGSGIALGPFATITVPELLAMPEINDGWRQVTLPWSTPVATTGSGFIYVTFDTDASRGAPWEILGADANPFNLAFQDIAVPTYGSSTAYARLNGDQDISADLSVMLIEAMPVPTGLAAVTAVQPLSVVDESCDLDIGGMPTGIVYVRLSWDEVTTAAVAGFGYYEVQRRDTTMAADTWETIGTVTNVASIRLDDYEARIGVLSSYRIRFVHVDGYTSAWSTAVTATVPAPGVTGTRVGVSVLVLTTNHNPDANLAHVMTWDGSGVPPQEFTFPEGSETTLQAMYGRDYRTAFRPLERGGVEFTRTLLVNALGVPPQTLSDGFNSLRDLAWDQVPYVCVRNEMSDRWLTSVSVPEGTVKQAPSAGHLMLAQAIFSEVTATPAPIDYENDCEGLILGERDNFNAWNADVGVNRLQGIRNVTDTFTRTLSGSWGAADTGQGWTLSTPANGSVNGSRGILAAPAVTTRQNATLIAVRDEFVQRVDVVLPAVATGNDYVVSQIWHMQDQQAFADNFNRTVSNGWGTASGGGAWTVSEAASFSTTGTRGRITMNTTGRKTAAVPYGRNNAEFLIGRIGLGAAVTGTGGIITASIELARNASGTIRTALEILFPTSGNISYRITSYDNGVQTDQSVGVSAGVTSATAVSARFRVVGYRVQATVWNAANAEPGTFGINEVLDYTSALQTQFGIAAEKNASVTNSGPFIEFDDVAAVTTVGTDSFRTDMFCKTTGSITVGVSFSVANYDETVYTNPVTGTYTAGTIVHMETTAQGFSVDGRVWIDGQTPPPHDGTSNGSVALAGLVLMPHSSGGRTGLSVNRLASNTNTTLAVAFDNLTVDNLPIEFDVRLLIRPIEDEWSLNWSAQAYFSQYGGGEWYAEASNARIRWYINGIDFAPIEYLNMANMGLVKNRLQWLRYNYMTDSGGGNGLLRLFTSTDGVTWNLKAALPQNGPVGVPVMPPDGAVGVQASLPAQGVWIHRAEMRADGVLLYAPDFAVQEPGTVQFTDEVGNEWYGQSALC